MRAEIISVGTELLLGQIIDTNAAALSAALSELGIAVFRRTTVGDNHDRLLDSIRLAIAENDCVVTIGGLGPTQDDITRDVLAEAFGDTLKLDDQIAARLRTFFRSRGMPVLQSNLRQAYVPTAGRAIPNPNGTAPGLLFEKNGKIGIALPGPPNEFLPMLADDVTPYLRGLTGARTIRSRVLRICGLGESVVEDLVKDLMASENPTVAPYAKTGEVHLRVTAAAEGMDAAYALIDPMVEKLTERLGHAVYALDDEPLEVAVVRGLRVGELTVCTAESCTGGMLASRITDVPGGSDVFLGGVVAYANEAKSSVLGVSADLIAEHGAVSAHVAEAMAMGVRRLLRADLGVGITGIAGPGGGTQVKPVGLVYIALAHRDGVETTESRYLGGRADVRYRATQTSLVMLRDRVLFVERAKRGGN